MQFSLVDITSERDANGAWATIHADTYRFTDIVSLAYADRIDAVPRHPMVAATL